VGLEGRISLAGAGSHLTLSVLKTDFDSGKAPKVHAAHCRLGSCFLTGLDIGLSVHI
jgi:hypothetical protein